MEIWRRILMETGVYFLMAKGKVFPLQALGDPEG
jgi:hypothetical protein